MKDILDSISRQVDKKIDARHLAELVAALRPPRGRDVRYTEQQIHALIAYMRAYPAFREALRNYLTEVFSQHNPIRLYTDSGILPSTGFFSETFKRLGHKFLPPLSKNRDLQSLLNLAFNKPKDYIWVEQVPNALWRELLESLGILEGRGHRAETPKGLQQFQHLINAVLILAHRLTAIGLEPDLVDKLPDMEDLQSPFFSLNREIGIYVEKLRQNPGAVYAEEEEDYRQILVMISQCRDSLDYLYRNKDKYGVSLRMTYLMIRLEQHLKRLETMLFIVEKEHRELWADKVIMLFKNFVKFENQRNSLSRHLSENLGLLTSKVVDHTSQKGTHYAAASKSEYLEMLRHALGGGAIVAFLVCFKALIAQWHLAPFGEAFMFSLNYALGFVLIFVLHFSLATKQPAMTASALAASIATDQKNRGQKGYKSKSIILMRQIARTQFIALIGNVAMVFPVAYIASWVFRIFFGEHVVPEAKALKMAKELHLWESGSLFFAAIAGVYLMLSGLIAGYYDNKVVHDRLPQRIKAHPLLQRFLPRTWINSLADYTGKNLGGISSNVYLGFFLGSTASIGFFLGLPLDIRHVTFGAGALAVSIVGSGHAPGWGPLIGAILGILGIGLVNVIVSFGLTLVVALRARNVQPRQTLELLSGLFREFRANPRNFFLPPETEHGDEKYEPEPLPPVALEIAKALFEELRAMLLPPPEAPALLLLAEPKEPTEPQAPKDLEEGSAPILELESSINKAEKPLEAEIIEPDKEADLEEKEDKDKKED